MHPLANLHGKIMPLDEVTISPLDRGFIFGDAVYEVLRIYAGKPFLEQEHFDRFTRGLSELRITGVDMPRMRRRMHETIQAGGFTESMVYLQVTRGAAPRKHAFPKDATPLELLWVQEYHDTYRPLCQSGCAVITHPDLRWHRADIKSTNLLGNVIANQAATEAGCAEAILYLPDGTLTEASHSSFFAVKHGQLHTTPLKANVLPSITRNYTVKLCGQANIDVIERNLQRGELDDADELFLVGTTCEVLPIISVDGKPVQGGQPGPVTRRLQAIYTENVRAFLRA
ncbi:MAG: aminotransferase class IV [Planctomycetes bacterium]|nr:aminotransferase class IV [Planctomycetota bacterium]